MNSARRGFVYLVGAGPGDPDLITVKGLRHLRQADVVVHDRLIAAELLDAAPPAARRIDVGKRAGEHPWPQARINRLLVAEALRGRRVVRLKGGDPFVFGRGAEEGDALAAAGIPFEVVPGITSAVAAPAAAGIPVTDRRYASSFTVVTGHACGTEDDELDWSVLARSETLVVLMGLGRLDRIVAELLTHGRAGATPAAMICRGATRRQVVRRGTLADIVARSAGLTSPATLIVGAVAAMNCGASHASWSGAGDGLRVAGGGAA